MRVAASTIKRQINIAHASTEAEIGAAILTLARLGLVAFVAAHDPFFANRREQLVTLAANGTGTMSERADWKFLPGWTRKYSWKKRVHRGRSIK